MGISLKEALNTAAIPILPCDEMCLFSVQRMEYAFNKADLSSRA
jgi:hypothetical protein